MNDSKEGNVPGITVLYGAAKLQAPQAAGRAESLAYQRNGLAVDTSSQPWRMVGTDTALTEQSWQAAETEIDQIVAQRVALFQKAAGSGVSEEEIIDQLIAYNRTLPERYTNLVGPAGDVSQLVGKASPIAMSADGATGSADAQSSTASQGNAASNDAGGGAQAAAQPAQDQGQDRSAWLRSRLKSLV
ncbi:hypothetical protein [Chitinimonas naiadis]